MRYADGAVVAGCPDTSAIIAALVKVQNEQYGLEYFRHRESMGTEIIPKWAGYLVSWHRNGFMSLRFMDSENYERHLSLPETPLGKMFFCLRLALAE